MLAPINRLTSRADFSRVTKSSIRSSTESLAGYLVNDPQISHPKIGFIVSRAIGGSVKRHQVTRKLRHASRNSLHILPQSALVVVRATKPNQSNSIYEIPNLFSALAKKASR